MNAPTTLIVRSIHIFSLPLCISHTFFYYRQPSGHGIDRTSPQHQPEALFLTTFQIIAQHFESSISQGLYDDTLLKNGRWKIWGRTERFLILDNFTFIAHEWKPMVALP